MESIRYYSPQQLADLLQVSLATVRAWRHRGTGPVGTRVGKHVRYAEADVLAWLASRRDVPPEPPGRQHRRLRSR